MTKKRTGKARSEGDIVEINLGDGTVSFAQVLADPLVAFFRKAYKIGEQPRIVDIARHPVMFRIWVHNSAIRSGRWKVVGHAFPSDELMKAPSFFKTDPVTKQLLRYDTGGKEMPASPEEVADLECAAIWDAEQVEERIRDTLSGKRNKIVDAFRKLAGLDSLPGVSA